MPVADESLDLAFVDERTPRHGAFALPSCCPHLRQAVRPGGRVLVVSRRAASSPDGLDDAFPRSVPARAMPAAACRTDARSPHPRSGLRGSASPGTLFESVRLVCVVRDPGPGLAGDRRPAPRHRLTLASGDYSVCPEPTTARRPTGTPSRARIAGNCPNSRLVRGRAALLPRLPWAHGHSIPACRRLHGA